MCFWQANLTVGSLIRASGYRMTATLILVRGGPVEKKNTPSLADFAPYDELCNVLPLFILYNPFNDFVSEIIPGIYN